MKVEFTVSRTGCDRLMTRAAHDRRGTRCSNNWLSFTRDHRVCWPHRRRAPGMDDAAAAIPLSLRTERTRSEVNGRILVKNDDRCTPSSASAAISTGAVGKSNGTFEYQDHLEQGEVLRCLRRCSRREAVRVGYHVIRLLMAQSARAGASIQAGAPAGDAVSPH